MLVDPNTSIDSLTGIDKELSDVSDMLVKEKLPSDIFPAANRLNKKTTMACLVEGEQQKLAE